MMFKKEVKFLWHVVRNKMVPRDSEKLRWYNF